MTTQTDAERWDEHYRSGTYREHWDYAHPSPDLVAIVAAGLVAEGSTVLDLGCGAGRNAVFLARCGFRTIGVDISPAALAIAAQRANEAGVEVDWRHGSVLDLPVEGASIGFAYDRGCFHIIARDDRLRFADEAARVLQPGARLLLHGGRRTGEAALHAVDEPEIDRVFDGERFSRGPVLPTLSYSDAGELEVNVVVLRRR